MSGEGKSGAARRFAVRSLAAALLGGTLAGPAHAAAGQVLFALGRVEIQRGSDTLVAQRGTALEVGDTITTGPSGMAQVKFRDGALLSLRYGSSMKVEDFRMPGGATTPVPGSDLQAARAAASGGEGGRSVLRLVRGAFRTITGLIGKGDADQYSVLTPAATIGIRGTVYSAALCSGDCGAVPDGLYLGVSNGRITVSNDGGELTLGDNQYGYVKDPVSPPAEELVPPEVLDAPIDGQGDAEEEGEPAAEADGQAATESAEGSTESADGAAETAASTDGAGGSEGDAEWGGATAAEASPPPEPATTSTTTTKTTTADSGTSRPEGTYQILPGTPGHFSFAHGGFRGAGDNGVYLDGSQNFIGFLTGAFTSIGSSQSVNRGRDELYGTNLRWGRWSGGSYSTGGNAVALGSQSLHWIYALQSQAPVMPVTGTATYALIGNTNPTDSLGNVGFLGSATFSACFSCGTVSSSLKIGINDQVWSASGSGGISGPLFAGSYGVSVNNAGGSPVATGGGTFNGFFANTGATGAGLTYSLTSGGNAVSGAAAFVKKP